MRKSVVIPSSYYTFCIIGHLRNILQKVGMACSPREDRQSRIRKILQKQSRLCIKKCFPEFANYRHKGYEFDAAYEDGKGGEKNFEGTIAKLQMSSYLTVSDFRPRLNKKGEEYGWAIAVYTLPEYLWDYKHVSKCYKEKPGESYEKIVKKIQKHFDCERKDIPI